MSFFDILLLVQAGGWNKTRLKVIEFADLYTYALYAFIIGSTYVSQSFWFLVT